MICLIIGYGSIGKRHKKLLEKMGHQVFVLTNQASDDAVFFNSLTKVLENSPIEYIVIANRTHDHYETLRNVLAEGYKGLLLIEKPLFDQVLPLPRINANHAFVGANLRFHPVINAMAPLVRGRALYAAQVYVGQYLPDWRPDTDYRKCYSAIRSQGGGVLKDLCHELDYTMWLTGGWRRVSSIGGKFSDLEIDSDDVFHLLLETEQCPVVSIHLNYLDRKPRREIIIHMEGKSVKGDLIENTLEVNGVKQYFQKDLDQTYIDQHISVMNSDAECLCSIEQGLNCLALIQKAEQASVNQRWEYQ